MNKREKEVLQTQLDKEKAVLKKLETQYQRALNDIINKTKILQVDIDALDQAIKAGDDDGRLASMKRSKVYQQQYQQALKKQIEAVLDKLHSDEYSTIQEYLDKCYEDGYLGTMYDLQGQGIPIVTPIDQKAVVQAVQLDSKVVEGYYNHLGVDFANLKKVIPQEISRGIASSLPYADIARNLNNASKAGRYNAMRIVRTEGHRIQNAAAYDAQQAAKAKGCKVVKQWDSTLDGKTRPTHRALDGQIREVEEYFEAAGKKAKYPGDFGDPAEDCNCRCTTLTRARWALDEEELKTLQDRARFFGLDKSDSFEDYKKKYLHSTNDEKTFTRNVIARNVKDYVDIASTMSYTISPTRKAYDEAIQTGELTPLASYELYQAISDEIESKIVGLTTNNGIKITGKSYHFISRVIGSVEEKRNGVSIDNIILALTNPDNTDDVKQRKNGKTQRFIKKGVCAVTVNPETGNLIQVNPLR